MKKLEFIMGMPVMVHIVGEESEEVFEKVFDYFREVDEQFSPYKAQSEVSAMNDGRIKKDDVSTEMKEILALCEKTKEESKGYFNPYNGENFDPSGIVKGWAIYKASLILEEMKYKNYYVEAGGDIQTHGVNEEGQKWRVGIRNPFNKNEYIKTLQLSGEGIATSGVYEKGKHIYNPKGDFKDDIVSLTVVGKNEYEADRFATACFAMGRDGISFIEELDGFEGYMVDKKGIATMTSGFEKYL